mgnify:CR=1 FL=1
MRQSDARFCRALDNLKMGIKSDIDYLNQNTAKAPLDKGIWLCGYNNTAAEKNELDFVDTDLAAVVQQDPDHVMPGVQNRP